AASRESKRYFTRSREAAKIGLLLAAALVPQQICAQDETERCTDWDCGEVDVTGTPPEPIIVTATGAPTYPERVGQAVTVIRKAEIELRQPSTLSDLLAQTPGVTVSNTGPIGGFSAVRIRGAEGEQTLALIDGVRLNDPSSPGGGFDFGNLLIGNIERVEVLRGPNSVPWGSQAIGGVVNVITQRPSDETEANVRAEYGSNDRANLVGNVSGKTGPVGFSLGGGYFRDDGISAAANGTEADGYRQYAANGRVEIELSDAISLDLRGYFADSRAQLDGFPPPAFSLADTPEYSTTQQLTGYAGFNARLGDLNNRLSFTISDINRDNFANPNATAPDFLARGRSERFEYQGDWQVGDSIRAVFGAEHERSRFLAQSFGPFGSTTRRGTNASSAYAQAIVDPVDSVTLTAGARIDDYKTYGSDVTFSANAVWRAGNATIIRAAYGEGFKAPTLFQLFSDFGDPDLQPEIARSYELGFEQGVLDNALRFGVTAFQRRTKNQIDFDLSSFTYNNILRSRAKGIEAFVEMRPSDRLAVRANYTYIDSKGRQDSATAFTRLLRRPLHNLNASIDWKAFDKVNLGADLRIASDSLDGFGGSVRMDGYALLAFRAAVPLSEKLELYGRVENATDTDYETVAGYGTYGRNAHVGIRLKL
ncbi:MAG: TonB-dependent receptor plug domain-containing protein, partial [Sphingorhabdus sp.]